MNRNERDALHERGTVALERVADELGERRRRLEAQELAVDSRRPLRRIFTGPALLRSIPGFAALWQVAVPAGRVLDAYDRTGERWSVVLCSCGEQTVLAVGALGECSGCPSRWFLHAGRSVRFKDFPVEGTIGVDAAAAA